MGDIYRYHLQPKSQLHGNNVCIVYMYLPPQRNVPPQKSM